MPLCEVVLHLLARDTERHHDDRDRYYAREHEAPNSQWHEKDPPRDQERSQPPPKRCRYTEDGAIERTSSTWRETRDREFERDRHDRKKSNEVLQEQRPAKESGCEHACHAGRVAEVRDLTRLVAEARGPSGGAGVRIAQSLLDLSAGESLGVIGLVLETLANSATPSDAEVEARWLESLSCFAGDRAAAVWDRYLQQPGDPASSAGL